MTYKINEGDAQIFHTDGESLASKKLRYKALCDEEYELLCDTSGGTGMCLSMAMGVLRGQIQELEKSNTGD